MKKDLNSGAYWEAFGRGVLAPEHRPTTQEAADFIIAQMIELEARAKEIADLKDRRKIDAQQYGVFLMEVQNVANKYRPTL